MALETRTLNYFVTLAEELHFGRAAARLNIVQPALSAQIKTLEGRLGTVLLKRDRHKVELTETGALFLAQARKALHHIGLAESIARQAAVGEVGHLRIGYVSSALWGGRLPQALSLFRRQYPQVSVRLDELSPRMQMARLAEETLDIGFAPLPLPLSNVSGIEVFGHSQERIVVVMPTDHPLGEKCVISPRDLADEPFILGAADRHAGWSDVIWRVCAAGGFTPRIVQSAETLPAVLALVNTGLGLTLVPQSATALHLDGVIYRPLDEEKALTSTIVLLAAKEATNPALKRFTDVVNGIK